jgi:two-component system, NarL family, response regulator LiaR
MQLAAKGYNNKAPGVQVAISDRTVQGHLAHLFAKMHVSTRTEAAMRGVSFGWITRNTSNLLEE